MKIGVVSFVWSIQRNDLYIGHRNYYLRRETARKEHKILWINDENNDVYNMETVPVWAVSETSALQNQGD